MISRKVLHIVTQLELGGAQLSALQILSHLTRSRYSPTLVSSDGKLAKEARRITGLSVRLYPSLRREVNPLADAMSLARLTSFIRRERFQLVHTHCSKAGILGRWAAHAAGVPAIVHSIHGFGFHYFQPALVRNFYQRLERLTARITDRLIVVSEQDQHTGLNTGIGTAAQYKLIRYGINAERFAQGRREDLRRELGLAPNQPLIGTVACLKPQKAPLDFVTACGLIRQQIPEAHFVLAGDGVLRAKVERLRNRLGLQNSLHLLGWREDIPRLLSAMDVFVLASRWEGLPIACLEAKAAGLPVIATTAGGIPEIIADSQNGFLVPVAEPKRLAKAVVSLVRDEALRHRAGEANRISINGHNSVERMVQQTEELYEELLTEKEVV